MNDLRFVIVAECWTCAYMVRPGDPANDTGDWKTVPTRLTPGRAEYHKERGHDVREVSR